MNPCCFKLSHLDYTSSLSLTISLFYKVSREEEDHRELQKSQRKTNKNTKLYTNLSLFSDQSFFAGPWCSLYSLRENSPEDEPAGRIWGSTAPDLPRARGKGAALLSPLRNNFLLEIGYEVVSHVAFQNLGLLRGSLWILNSNLGLILILNLIPLIIAN